MTESFRRLLIPIVICACGEFSFASDVSYLQAPLPGGEGFLSEPPTDQNADDFSFIDKIKVKLVRWWGTYISSTPEPDHFTLRFYGNGSGNPQLNPTHSFTNLSVGRSNSGVLDAFGDTIYQYEAPIPSSVVLSAGSTSYISVLNDTANGWFWQRNSNSGSNWFRFDDQDSWDPANSGNLAFEILAVTPPPGDYNADFVVNNVDFNVWKQSFGSTTLRAADGNGNGVVDAADYVVWRKNLGTLVAASVMAHIVPEPTTLVLLLLAAAGCCLRRGQCV